MAEVQKVFKGANFPSFAEFEAAFEEWKEVFHHPFRVASSEKHEDPALADRFKYRYVVYHCSRYGEPRKRGAGRRPHQNYLPCGCQAKLRLNYHDKDAALQVTTLETTHNHDPMMEDGSGGGFSGSAKRQQKSTTKEEADSYYDANGGAKSEYSPNNIGTLNIPPQLSPLSLQPGMHNSPSSCGQSSSEGLTDAIGQSELDLLQTPRQQSAAISVASILSAAVQQLHQRQASMASSTNLTTTLPHSAEQQGMSSTFASSSVSSSSAIPSAAINSNNSLPNLLSLLQLQMLLNASSSTGSPAAAKPPTIQNYQQQQQTPFNNNNMANAHLLQQLLAASGQQQQKINQKEQQQQHPNYCGHMNKSSSNILGTTNFAPLFGGTADAEPLEVMTRNELIKEADLLVQMLVKQMIGTTNLREYLRRLRQFLTENFN